MVKHLQTLVKIPIILLCDLRCYNYYTSVIKTNVVLLGIYLYFNRHIEAKEFSSMYGSLWHYLTFLHWKDTTEDTASHF